MIGGYIIVYDVDHAVANVLESEKNHVYTTTVPP